VYAWADHAATEVCSTAEEHFAVGQIAALVRKFPFDWKTLNFKCSPEEAARETFLASEMKCKKINRLFPRIKRTPYAFHLDYMRRWVHHVLGDAPNLEEVYSKCDFGPGANVGFNGNKTNIFRKLLAKDYWTVSNAAEPYVVGALRFNTNLSLHLYDSNAQGYLCFTDDLDERIRSRLRKISYNQLSFVPKTAKTHRVIAVEPLLSSFVQKGIDQVLRGKLKRHGYDLADQERNKSLAKQGSIDDSLSTMDLSSASDSISNELVKFLLPIDWWELLLATRSACYKLDNVIAPYEKFCSMGNGFCFPLETLIFAAASRAAMHASQKCESRTHAVYGDDIIVPQEAYDLLRRLLGVIGFTVNSRKSFKTGPFRESCGADWYDGQDVRPVYLDYPLETEVHLRIFHNVTLRSQRADIFFQGVRPFLREEVPEKHRYLRPWSKIVVSFDPHKCKSRRLQPSRFFANGILYHEGGKDYGFGPFEAFITAAGLNGAFDVAQDEFMSSRWARWHRDEQRWTWKEVLYTPFEDKAVHPLYLRGRYLAFLRGSPSGRLAQRRKTRPTVIIK
jgi:hypothetical protein